MALEAKQLTPGAVDQGILVARHFIAGALARRTRSATSTRASWWQRIPFPHQVSGTCAVGRRKLSTGVLVEELWVLGGRWVYCVKMQYRSAGRRITG